MKEETLKTILLAAFLVAVVVFAPFAAIWALNVLFPALAIPYTFETWAASIILGGVFRTTVPSKN